MDRWGILGEERFTPEDERLTSGGAGHIIEGSGPIRGGASFLPEDGASATGNGWADLRGGTRILWGG